MPKWIEDRMLDKDELVEVTKLSASSIEEQIRQGSFPRPRVLSPKRTAWLASEVVEWMRNRPASDLPPPPNTSAKKSRRAGTAGPAVPA
jgi:prophage regulatory protein